MKKTSATEKVLTILALTLLWSVVFCLMWGLALLVAYTLNPIIHFIFNSEYWFVYVAGMICVPWMVYESYKETK